MPHPIPHLHEILAREAAIGSAIWGGYTPKLSKLASDIEATRLEAAIEQHRNILYIKRKSSK